MEHSGRLLAAETTLKGPALGPAIYTRGSRDTWPNHSRKAGTGQVAPPIVAGGKVDPWLLYVQEGKKERASGIYCKVIMAA